MQTFSASVPLHPVDLRRSFALQAFGHFDPTACWSGDRLLKTFAAGGGVCSVTVRAESDGLHFEATGAGAEAVVHQLGAWAGLDDGYGQFSPAHPAVAQLHRRIPGLRLMRVPWLFDIACSAVLQQRVRSTDAMRDWCAIARRWGTPGSAPEYGEQVAFPSPGTFAAIPLHDLIALGLDPKRARTLLALARACRFRPLRDDLNAEQIGARLASIDGVGPWTVAMALGFGLGNTDAVPVGDLYLPHLVAFAFTGAPRGSDALMLELLEPYRPHRFRVVRLLYAAEFAVPGWSAG